MKPIDSTDAEIDAFDTVCRRLGGFVGHIDAEWVDGYLNFRGRIERDDWVRQAKALARGGEAEYVRVFGRKPR